MSEVRQPKIGDVVVFVDERSARHNALLTAVHGTATEHGSPAVNLEHVSADESKTDPYGRQIERRSSVVHRGHQSAHGMYWDYSIEG